MLMLYFSMFNKTRHGLSHSRPSLDSRQDILDQDKANFRAKKESEKMNLAVEAYLVRPDLFPNPAEMAKQWERDDLPDHLLNDLLGLQSLLIDEHDKIVEKGEPLIQARNELLREGPDYWKSKEMELMTAMDALEYERMDAEIALKKIESELAKDPTSSDLKKEDVKLKRELTAINEKLATQEKELKKMQHPMAERLKEIDDNYSKKVIQDTNVVTQTHRKFADKTGKKVEGPEPTKLPQAERERSMELPALLKNEVVFPRLKQT
jgi:hypothetical protein